MTIDLIFSPEQRLLRASLLAALERSAYSGMQSWSTFEPMACLLCDCGAARERRERRRKFSAYLSALGIFAKHLHWRRFSGIKSSGHWESLPTGIVEILVVKCLLTMMQLVRLRHALLGRDERVAVASLFGRVQAMSEGLSLVPHA